MTTITFKVNEAEARKLRLVARREQSTVSEFLRRCIHEITVPENSLRRVKCRHTGAMIFKPTGETSQLTLDDVKRHLRDFP